MLPPSLRILLRSPAVVLRCGNLKQQQARYVHTRFSTPHRGGGGGSGYQRFPNWKKSPDELWRDPTFRKLAGGTVLGAGTFYVYNTEVVPVTGRRRFNIVSPTAEVMMARQMYEQTVREFGARILPRNHPTSRYVQKVLDRLIPVCGLEDVNWEVFVIKDDSIRNAFVIPGGKVFVFSGILPICGDEGGLAAVMSHEIAHTVAHHSAERMSKSFLVLAVVILAGITIGDPDSVGRMTQILLDLVFLRPGSRKQEAEADYIGLMMMAQACYDPAKAVTLWKRMEKAEKHSMPQFLSTHPSNSRRIQNIKEWLPEAELKSEASDCTGATLQHADEFLKTFQYPRW